jgi:hypothetical protein
MGRGVGWGRGGRGARRRRPQLRQLCGLERARGGRPLLLGCPPGVALSTSPVPSLEAPEPPCLPSPPPSPPHPPQNPTTWTSRMSPDRKSGSGRCCWILDTYSLSSVWRAGAGGGGVGWGWGWGGGGAGCSWRGARGRCSASAPRRAEEHGAAPPPARAAHLHEVAHALRVDLALVQQPRGRPGDAGRPGRRGAAVAAAAPLPRLQPLRQLQLRGATDHGFRALSSQSQHRLQAAPAAQHGGRGRRSGGKRGWVLGGWEGRRVQGTQ